MTALLSSNSESLCFRHETALVPYSKLSPKPKQDIAINGYHIPAGMSVVIPTFALQKDVWPHADKFDPDRFLPENKSELHDYKWLPFGIGRRNCLGKRLGLLEFKEAVVVLLQRCRFLVAPDTEIPVKLEKSAFLHPENDHYVGVDKRE